MNEFTKEELIYMRDGIELIQDKCNISKQIDEKLDSTRSKIQSLIDNYCDHSDCFELDTDSIILGCNDCDKVWYE